MIEEEIPIDQDRFKVTVKARGSLRPCHRAYGMVTDKACQTEPHILNNLRQGKLEKFKSLRPTNFQVRLPHPSGSSTQTRSSDCPLWTLPLWTPL